MIEFQEYVRLMSELLQATEPGDVDSDVSLYDDWGIDSLQTLELMILTEQLAGLSVPPLEVPAIFTLGDAYGYYTSCLRSASHDDD